MLKNTSFFERHINLNQLDAEKFPMHKYAQAYQATLEPGDVLYVPPHTWHHVENLTDSVAVGYRYSSLKAAMKSSKTFTFVRALSTNPPLWKTRQYGKEDTNLIWAHANGDIKEVREEMAKRDQSQIVQ